MRISVGWKRVVWMVVKDQVFPVYPDDQAFPTVLDYPLSPYFLLIIGVQTLE